MKPNRKAWKAERDAEKRFREREALERVQPYRCSDCGYSRWIQQGRDIVPGLCVCRVRTGHPGTQ